MCDRMNFMEEYRIIVSQQDESLTFVDAFAVALYELMQTIKNQFSNPTPLSTKRVSCHASARARAHTHACIRA